MTTFKSLGLREDIVNSLKNLEIDKPTEIQEKAIPIVLNEKNLIAQSETGTGKTLAYILPIIEKIDDTKKDMQCIVVAPTYELAIQINNTLNDLKRGMNRKITSLSLVGSGNISRQIEKLKGKPHILVGSSGRILELIKKRKISAHTINFIVMDEGDKLLDFNYIEEVNAIIKSCKRDVQKLLFSATLTEKTLEVGKKILKDCEVLSIRGKNQVNENIMHGYFLVEERDKIDYLRRIIHATKAEKLIAFINNNYDINIMLEKLRYHKIKVESLHGNNKNRQRQEALEKFRKGEVQVLIASDVASRGLDIKGVSHIVNLDIPRDYKDYLHRVGRVGRCGNKGIAYSLANYKEEKTVLSYEKKLKIKIPRLCMYDGQISDVKVVKLKFKKKTTKLKVKRKN